MCIRDRDGSFSIGKGEVFQRHVLRRRDIQCLQLFRLLHQRLDALPRDLGFAEDDLLAGKCQTLDEILPEVLAEVKPFEAQFGHSIPVFVARCV